MSNWNTQKVRRLKKQWADITSGRNVSDHGLATWAKRAGGELGEEFTEFCTSPEGLGVHGNTVRSYERMGRALEKVDQADVWKAVGWNGVRLLCRIEKQKEVNAICRWIVTQAKKAPVAESALRSRIEEKAKSYKAVGGGGGGRNNGDSPASGKTKKKLKDEVEKLTIQNVTLKSKHEALVADITKVIAKWPILKKDLSKASLSTLGLDGGQLPKVRSA